MFKIKYYLTQRNITNNYKYVLNEVLHYKYGITNYNCLAFNNNELSIQPIYWAVYNESITG